MPSGRGLRVTKNLSPGTKRRGWARSRPIPGLSVSSKVASLLNV